MARILFIYAYALSAKEKLRRCIPKSYPLHTVSNPSLSCLVILKEMELWFQSTDILFELVIKRISTICQASRSLLESWSYLTSHTSCNHLTPTLKNLLVTRVTASHQRAYPLLALSKEATISWNSVRIFEEIRLWECLNRFILWWKWFSTIKNPRGT